MRASLASRFLLTLLVTAVVPVLLLGYFALRGMRQLTEHQVVAVFLPQLAADGAQKIDARLQQIYQACSVVREIARTALHDEASQRTFGEQVEQVPDLLDNYLDLLLLLAPDGRVVASRFGRLLDQNIEGRRRQLLPRTVSDAPWFTDCQQRGGAAWLPWGRSPYMHRGLDHRSLDPADYHLGLVLDVPLAGGAPGVLLALVRWPEVQQILDSARAVLTEAGYPSAEVVLVDQAGRIQACTERARYGETIAPEALGNGLLGAPGGTVAFTDADGNSRLCGFARCGADTGQRWSLGLHMASDELFAGGEAFGRVLVLVLILAVVFLGLWSLVASRAIVRPVRALVAATASLARGDLGARVPGGGGRELSELGNAFNAMAGELAAGRERLKAAERQAAWAEMARQIAHEIKNPLTPMRMTAQLLQRARREHDPRAEAVADRLAHTVIEQTDALDRIASDFRHLAGAPQRQLEDLELDALLTDVRAAATSLFEGGRLQLELQAGAPGIRVHVDKKELGRVFLNLLQNAAQAQPAGVHVQLSSSAGHGMAVVLITDDGPGVPAEVLPRLFEPYFTTKSSGTGLGLAICRRIVEAHGGSISLQESAPGRTVFRLTLPLATPATTGS